MGKNLIKTERFVKVRARTKEDVLRRINGLKQCVKCGMWLEEKLFGNRKATVDGLNSRCKACCRGCIDKKAAIEYRKNNKEILRKKRKDYYRKNKDRENRNCAKYYKKHLQERKEYLFKNKDYIKKRASLYDLNNKEKILKYRKDHKEQIIAASVKRDNSKAIYETYAHQLTVDESPMVSSDGVSMTVLCAYCGKRFILKTVEVRGRVQAINGGLGECRLYCSEGCKQACPIYNQIKYPKGFRPATSREVQPQLRQMVLKRDNYTCQKCGERIENKQLHCHHIYPLNESPITSADIDECITLCVDCHKEVHMNTAGCGYSEMKCSGFS